MNSIEIQYRLKLLGRDFPNKYLAGVFKTRPEYITLAIQDKQYPKLKAKIIKHIELLEAKADKHPDYKLTFFLNNQLKENWYENYKA